MEEGIFPSDQAIYGGPMELEEERRLSYVAITRARKRLYITHSNTRMLYGSTSRNAVSRFVSEIPDRLCDKKSAVGFFDFGIKTSGESAYRSKREDYDYSKIFKAPTSSKPQNNSAANYTVGMTVEHKTFGKGMITKIVPMGNDAMLEIAFDSVGTKKIMAGYVKLNIV
jgi:DNA helicase-2/ATP-dependent DNA helicase PcrA